MAKKLVLAMDMVDLHNEYIDKLGDIWLNLNAIAISQNWALDVLIYRQKCPDIKQSGTIVAFTKKLKKKLPHLILPLSFYYH